MRRADGVGATVGVVDAGDASVGVDQAARCGAAAECIACTLDTGALSARLIVGAIVVVDAPNAGVLSRTDLTARAVAVGGAFDAGVVAHAALLIVAAVGVIDAFDAGEIRRADLWCAVLEAEALTTDARALIAATVGAMGVDGALNTSVIAGAAFLIVAAVTVDETGDTL